MAKKTAPPPSDSPEDTLAGVAGQKGVETPAEATPGETQSAIAGDRDTAPAAEQPAGQPEAVADSATDQPSEAAETDEPALPESALPDDVPAPAGTDRDGAEETGTETDRAPKPAPPVAVTPDAGRPARGPGVLTLLTGGILAAVVGFGAARFVIPEGWPFGPVSQATRDLTAALDEQAARLEALGAKVDANAKTAAAASDAAKAAESQVANAAEGLSTRLGDLESQIAPLHDAATRIDTFDQRLTALERQPANDGSASKAAIESFQRELTDLRQMLDAERARNAAAEAEAASRAKAVQAEAAALAKQAARDAAFAQLSQGLASGGSLTDAVEALKKAGVAVPDAISTQAADGVPTLDSLQKGFAEPARAALAATADKGSAGQIGAFLKAQFGVRSLAPRAGDSPDAILSRAEAAAQAGDLARAISELKTLPEAGQAAMADWIKAASARQAVVEAAATLAPQ